MKLRSRLPAVVAAAAMMLAFAQPAVLAEDTQSLADIAEELIECFDVDGESFCLFIGFVDMKPGDPRWTEAFGAEAEKTIDDPGGSMAGYVRYLSQLPSEDLKRLAEESVQEAYATIGKVKLFDYVGLDLPIPLGFFDQYSQLGIEEGSAKAEALRTAAATGRPLDLTAFYTPTRSDHVEEAKSRQAVSESPIELVGVQPELLYSIDSVPGSPTYRYIIYSAYRAQERDDFCAPATFQSIDGADDGWYNTQSSWADDVGWYNSDGTYTGSVYKLRTAINNYTNWDNLAGTYAVIDSDAMGASWYFDVHQINIGLEGAPLVDHVKLSPSYFPYVDDPHSGHFQTGRGYSRNTNTISYFEPFNAAKWDSSGEFSAKVQYLHYSNLYGANQLYPAADTNILA